MIRARLLAALLLLAALGFFYVAHAATPKPTLNQLFNYSRAKADCDSGSIDPNAVIAPDCDELAETEHTLELNRFSRFALICAGGLAFGGATWLFLGTRKGKGATTP